MGSMKDGDSIDHLWLIFSEYLDATESVTFSNMKYNMHLVDSPSLSPALLPGSTFHTDASTGRSVPPREHS